MVKYVRLLVAALLIAVLALTACQTGTQPTSENEAEVELLPFRYVLNPFISNSAIFIADKEGYFEDAGLAIEFVPFERTSEAVPALIQGEVEAVGPGSSTALFNAMAQGSPIYMVADKGSFGTNDCYASLLMSPVLEANGGLEALESLEGLVYLGSEGAMSQFGAERWLMETYGLDMSVMSFERTPDAILGEALASGAGALHYSAEPERTQLLESGQAVEIALASELLPNTQWATIVFGPSVTEDNPELGRRFMVAYLRATRQYNEGKTDRNIEILAEATGLEADEVEKLCWPTIDNSLIINADPFADYIEWGFERGLMDSVFDINNNIDMSYVDYAMAELGDGD